MAAVNYHGVFGNAHSDGDPGGDFMVMWDKDDDVVPVTKWFDIIYHFRNTLECVDVCSNLIKFFYCHLSGTSYVSNHSCFTCHQYPIKFKFFPVLFVQDTLDLTRYEEDKGHSCIYSNEL